MAEAKVIVIEPAELEANALQALLRFLDLERGRLQFCGLDHNNFRFNHDWDSFPLIKV